MDAGPSQSPDGQNFLEFKFSISVLWKMIHFLLNNKVSSLHFLKIHSVSLAQTSDTCSVFVCVQLRVFLAKYDFSAHSGISIHHINHPSAIDILMVNSWNLMDSNPYYFLSNTLVSSA